MNSAPYRPAAIAALNRLGRLFERMGIRTSLDSGALLDAARRSTGLDDFGGDDVVEPLEVLTRSINEESCLHPFGRWIVRKRLTDILITRLRAQALVKRFPQILDQQIEAPLVIAGLQRTGTTMLHRLLAAAPNNRALLSWEALNPLPPEKLRADRPDPRIRAARVAEKGLAYLAPGFFAIHPVEAQAPEEDVLLMEFSLRSQVPEAMFRVPTYARWRDAQDPAPAYAWLYRLLQILQWQAPGRRWILKTPAHLEHLDTLLRAFPDARIIQTHRDPLQTAASFASMLTHGYGVFSDRVDPQEIAAHWTAKNARMVQRALQVRRQHRAAFIDVNYADLIADPMLEVERIYAFAGLELEPKSRQTMEAARSRNRQHKYGRHDYRLEQFGLSASQIDAQFAAYRDEFSIPRERDAA